MKIFKCLLVCISIIIFSSCESNVIENNDEFLLASNESLSLCKSYDDLVGLDVLSKTAKINDSYTNENPMYKNALKALDNSSYTISTIIALDGSNDIVTISEKQKNGEDLTLTTSTFEKGLSNGTKIIESYKDGKYYYQEYKNKKDYSSVPENFLETSNTLENVYKSGKYIDSQNVEVLGKKFVREKISCNNNLIYLYYYNQILIGYGIETNEDDLTKNSILYGIASIS